MSATSRLENIESTLRGALHPAHLEVLNESHMHAVKPGAETHFKIIVVADEFEGLPLIDRHRRINQLLAAELSSGLHALSIHAMSPSQWKPGSTAVLNSPACLGGTGK